MSDYGSLYLIETSYNPDRDATEVIFGYMEKEKSIKGRVMSIRVIVNVEGCRDMESQAVSKGLKKARQLLARSAKADYDD